MSAIEQCRSALGGHSLRCSACAEPQIAYNSCRNQHYTNKDLLYALLFDIAAETLRTIAANPKHLDARIGTTLVLHTRGSALTHHPHVHGIVPGGGPRPRCRSMDTLQAKVLYLRAGPVAPVPASLPRRTAEPPS